MPAILALPTYVDMPDVFAWHLDAKGIFSVKLAYRLFCDDRQRSSTIGSGAASSGNAADDEKLWASIWKLEGPNRLKHSGGSLIIRWQSDQT